MSYTRTLGVPGSGTFVSQSALPVFDPRTYGAPWDGSGDDRAGLTAAVVAAVATITATGKGAVVQLPAGIGNISSVPLSRPAGYTGDMVGIGLPVNLPGNLIIKGAGKNLTTIKLSSNCRGLFWIQKIADHDVFQNVSFEDFSIDNNNTVGRGQILIGNVPDRDTAQQYIGVSKISVKRIATYNVPLDITQATTYKALVWFQNTQATANEATVDSCVDVTCEDLDINDAQNGVLIFSPGPNSTSFYYNQINIRRCRHVISAVPAATLSQTSFFVCGSGYGDSFEISDCYSENVGDDAAEIGAMQRGTISRLWTKNAFLESVLFRNTHALAAPQSQQISLVDCNFDIDARPWAVSGISGFGGRPVMWISDAGSGNFGTFIIQRCSYRLAASSISKLGSRTSAGDLGWQIKGAVRRVVMDACRVHIDGLTFDSSFSLDLNLLETNLSPAGNMTGGSVNNGEFVCRDFEGLVETVTNASGFNLNLHGYQPKGALYKARVDGFTFLLVNSNGVNTATVAYIASTTGNIQEIKLRDLGGVALGTTNIRRGVRVLSTGTVTRFSNLSPNFSNWTTSGVLDSDYGGAAAAATTTMTNAIEAGGQYAQTASVVSVTATYTALLVNEVILASGTFTITGPPARKNGRYTVRNTGAGTITVTPAAGTVNGAANVTVAAGAASTFVCDGTNWFTI